MPHIPILNVDGHPVKSIEDIKIALVFRNSGDAITVKTQRTDASQRREELEFNVTLQ